MLGLAALLWFVYLVPTWRRRSEYLATERTATRLQQTIRVMAETAEVPEEVRVAVSVKEAARQERILRAREKAAARAAERAAMDAARSVVVSTGEGSPARREAAVSDGDLRRRMRRTRAVASLALLAALAVGGVQAWLLVATGFTVGGVVIVAVAATVALGAVSVQRRLDARSARLATAPAARRGGVVADFAVGDPVAEAAPEWTPVAMPRPLYLSRPTAPAAPVSRAGLEQALAAAVADAEQKLRDAHSEPEVAPIRPAAPAPRPAARPAAAPAARPAASSRFAGMGRLGAGDTSATDLDEVLRRRRSAG